MTAARPRRIALIWEGRVWLIRQEAASGRGQRLRALVPQISAKMWRLAGMESIMIMMSWLTAQILPVLLILSAVLWMGTALDGLITQAARRMAVNGSVINGEAGATSRAAIAGNMTQTAHCARISHRASGIMVLEIPIASVTGVSLSNAQP